MDFTLTEEHLRRGVQEDCLMCPIALVIQERMQDSLYRIEGDSLTHEGYDLWFPLPDEVREWVHAYDRYWELEADRIKKEGLEPRFTRHVEPIEFVLPLENYLGKPYTHIKGRPHLRRRKTQYKENLG